MGKASVILYNADMFTFGSHNMGINPKTVLSKESGVNMIGTYVSSPMAP